MGVGMGAFYRVSAWTVGRGLGGKRRIGGGKRKGRRLPHGLNPKTFPLTVREFVEVDYIRDLSDSERQWLARFNDREHGADFRKDNGETSVTDRRIAYKRKNKANQDVYATARAQGLACSETAGLSGERVPLLDTLAAEEQDLSRPPAYLKTAEYQSALAHLRSLLPENARNKTRNTPQLRAAYARLERAKRGVDG